MLDKPRVELSWVESRRVNRVEPAVDHMPSMDFTSDSIRMLSAWLISNQNQHRNVNKLTKTMCDTPFRTVNGGICDEDDDANDNDHELNCTIRTIEISITNRNECRAPKRQTRNWKRKREKKNNENHVNRVTPSRYGNDTHSLGTVHAARHFSNELSMRGHCYVNAIWFESIGLRFRKAHKSAPKQDQDRGAFTFRCSVWVTAGGFVVTGCCCIEAGWAMNNNNHRQPVGGRWRITSGMAARVTVCWCSATIHGQQENWGSPQPAAIRCSTRSRISSLDRIVDK